MGHLSSAFLSRLLRGHLHNAVHVHVVPSYRVSVCCNKEGRACAHAFHPLLLHYCRSGVALLRPSDTDTPSQQQTMCTCVHEQVSARTQMLRIQLAYKAVKLGAVKQQLRHSSSIIAAKRDRPTSPPFCTFTHPALCQQAQVIYGLRLEALGGFAP